MRSAAVAVVVGALLLTASAAGQEMKPAELEQTRGFCAARPTAVDTSFAGAVNALDVGVPDTPPIAVLDTGVDGGATEIGGRLVSPFDALSNQPNDGADVDGHGTQIAGLAAGAPGLIRGVSPTSPVMPVRIYNGDGQSTTDAVVKGIGWAVDQGAAVIALSSTAVMSKASDAEITAYTKAISQAFNRGVIVVAPAGNEGSQDPDIPAALPHVLTVGATDLAGSRATFSNVGWWVDVMALGASVVAPSSKAYCDSGYGLGNGTSYAAAAGAGAVALLAKLRPELTAQQRIDVLRASAKDIQLPGRDVETGHGVIDVAAAIAAAAPPITGASPEVDDDPYFVRGPFAAAHPTRLRTSRKATLTGTLSRAKDPSDVYPVFLKKGESFVASTKAASPDSLFSLGIWSPAVGDFDVSAEVAKNRVVSTGGFAVDPVLRFRVKKGGTYFVSVEVPDLIDEDQSDEQTSPPEIPESEGYTLKLSRQKIKTRPKPTKKKSKKKSSAKKK